MLRTALGLPARDEAVLARVLVVLADHELNASTFSARVTTSTGATLAASMSAALATVSGPRHGAASAAFEALLAEVGHKKFAHRALSARLARGEGVPGFGHRLYPQGDPRAPWLLEHPAIRDHDDVAVVFAVNDAWQALAGRGELTMPTVDVALVAACRALGLPPGMGAALFAIARSAGWVAHIFEQRRSSTLLRPRARYIGPA